MMFSSVACFVAFSAIIVGGAVISEHDQRRHLVTGRVVNGNTATPGQFPYVVSLRWVETQKHKCGSTIVRSNWLISAAHSVVRVNVSEIEAVAGAHYTHQNGFPYELDEIILHPEYTEETYLADIALLRTKLEIEFTRIVQPIALGVDYVPGGMHVRSKGWGNIYFGTRPEELQYLDQTTLTNKDCMSRHTKEERVKIHESSLCTYSGYIFRAMCHGDSGGALVTDDNVMVGLVSWGVKCGYLGKPDVFTRISSFVPWILEEIDEESTKEKPELSKMIETL